MSTNTYTKCPSANQFEKYLHNQMQKSELVAFVNHLEQCEICKQAIDGYLGAGISNPKLYLQKSDKTFLQKKSTSVKTFFQIAATAIIMLGLGFSIKLILNQWKNNHQMAMSNCEPVTSAQYRGSKKLLNKSKNQYLYLGEKHAFFINDQMVSKSQLNKPQTFNSSTAKIIIQVENSNYRQSAQIINQIKSQHQVPVLTIRNIGSNRKVTE